MEVWIVSQSYSSTQYLTINFVSVARRLSNHARAEVLTVERKILAFLRGDSITNRSMLTL